MTQLMYFLILFYFLGLVKVVCKLKLFLILLSLFALRVLLQELFYQFHFDLQLLMGSFDLSNLSIFLFDYCLVQESSRLFHSNMFLNQVNKVRVIIDLSDRLFLLFLIQLFLVVAYFQIIQNFLSQVIFHQVF